jgi:hypothetical protein
MVFTAPENVKELDGVKPMRGILNGLIIGTAMWVGIIGSGVFVYNTFIFG